MGMDKIAKAVSGGLTALGGALVTALADGAVTATEWVIVAVAGIGAFGAVWATPNAQSEVPSGVRHGRLD